MLAEKAGAYIQVAQNSKAMSMRGKLEIPATLILDLGKQSPRASNTQVEYGTYEHATIVSFSPEAEKAAQGPVTTMDAGNLSTQAKAPTHEIVTDEDGRTHMSVTFYGSDGRAVLTIPPQEPPLSRVASHMSQQSLQDFASYRLLNEAA